MRYINLRYVTYLLIYLWYVNKMSPHATFNVANNSITRTDKIARPKLMPYRCATMISTFYMPRYDVDDNSNNNNNNNNKTSHVQYVSRTRLTQ